MKHIKRFVSLLLVLVVAMAVTAVPALAADTGTITINHAFLGETYKAYKIFDAVVGKDAAGKDIVSYTIPIGSDIADSDVSVTVEEGGSSKEYKFSDIFGTAESGGTTYVSQKGGVSDSVVTAWMKVYVEGAGLTPSYSVKATGQTAEIKNVLTGYYYVTSTTGSLVTISTATPDATIEDKNEAPGVKKEVSKTENGDYGADTTASIGDTVYFKLTVEAKRGARNYVVHDTMTEGLTLNAGSFEVIAGGTELTVNTDYTLATKSDTPASINDGCTFEIKFTEAYLDKISGDTTITITYSAVLNENAKIGGDGNKNTLDYGDSSKVESGEVKVYTYSFDLVKTDKDKKLLTGAEFELYSDQALTKKILFIKNGTTYRVAKTGETGADGTISIDSAEKVVISGLGNGTYYLKETKAPNGYKLLLSAKDITIDGQNIGATFTGDTYESGGVHVTNEPGTTLPGTGGTGTTVFYVLGSALMLGAVVLYITKKRVHMTEK